MKFFGKTVIYKALEMTVIDVQASCNKRRFDAHNRSASQIACF